MRTNALFILMIAATTGLHAQIKTDHILTTTWKQTGGTEIFHEFVATKGEVSITNDDILIVPQCYEWDYHYKIIESTDQRLVVEKYNYVRTKELVGSYVPSGITFSFEKTDITKEQYKKLIQTAEG